MNVDVPTFRRNIFQEMRGNLDQKFSGLTFLVNQRKIALFQKIDDLELEYNNKINQFEKDKQTLIELREHTEQKLGQNSLLELQTDIVSGINKNIKNLEKESKLHLDLVLTLNWDFDGLKLLISQMDLKLTPQNRSLSTGLEDEGILSSLFNDPTTFPPGHTSLSRDAAHLQILEMTRNAFELKRRTRERPRDKVRQNTRKVTEKL